MKARWKAESLGDVLSKTETTDPTRSPQVEFDYIDVSSVSNETLSIQTTQRLKGKDAPSRARRLVAKSDVLFATIRPTLRRIAIVPEELDGQVCSTGYFVLRPQYRVDNRFLFYFLQTEDFMGEMAKLQKGASYPAVTDGDVRAQKIPVPPLPEQQRIVRLLDEAFAGLATAQAHAEKNLQNARALFESHLESVFTRRGKGWVQTTIGEVAEVFDGPHATPKTVDAGPIFLGISALQDGQINLGETRHVTPDDFRRWTRRVKPQANDVVFSYETRLGQAAIIPEGLECCLGRRMGLVRLHPNRIEPRFFVWQYVSRPFRAFLDSRTVRGATVDRIALKDFPSFPIVLPGLNEQERIADQLESLRSEVRRLEILYQQKLASLTELKKSLLHQAFSGQL